MTPKIKICGVTLADDAARVASAGADFIGLNFWPRSKRYVDLDHAPPIAAAARGAGAVQLVGVFVDATLEDIQAVTAHVGLDVIQLHGSEDPAFVAAVATATQRPVWKAISIQSADDVDALAHWPADALLLDAPNALIRHARHDAGVDVAAPGGAISPTGWALAGQARRRHPARRFILAGGLDPTNVSLAIAAATPWCVDVASGVESAPGIKDLAKVAAFVAAVRT